MTINYQLTNSDFLEYQLYTSSKSKSHKKKRLRSRYIVFILYTLLGLYFAYKNGNNGIGVIIASFGLLWFAFYPMYAKWNYKRHFKKHVEENYKNRISKPVEIDFDENSVNAKDFTSESRINGTELKELIETKDHFFIKLTTDLSLIVPKHSIENQSEFIKRVTELGAEYVDELNWKWK
ncbi:YcxB family protein [Croceibacter atlanticus]|mgnify:FL=1|uniref:YcxB family protein n=1 Tax=Croceibacter atlanticus TaxID=313588 RepID=UPI002E1063C7|nr:YcxB family protein [Croceibacter atlanticus]|tara:strand:- start:58 stop:594 length:537 start_codon:yes stop_codon:yes gene_type:complete